MSKMVNTGESWENKNNYYYYRTVPYESSFEDTEENPFYKKCCRCKQKCYIENDMICDQCINDFN